MKANNHTFIDSKTYEIIKDEQVIEVDDAIAETISVLNKKGYKTKYCCSGHVKDIFRYDRQVCDISLLDENKFKEDFVEYFITNITDTNFSLITPREFTAIYIKFLNDYNFQELPIGFIKYPKWDDKLKDYSKTCFDLIEYKVSYYQDKMIRTIKDVEEEINKYNKLLLEWANNLPDINERND